MGVFRLQLPLCKLFTYVVIILFCKWSGLDSNLRLPAIKARGFRVSFVLTYWDENYFFILHNRGGMVGSDVRKFMFGGCEPPEPPPPTTPMRTPLDMCSREQDRKKRL